MLGILWMKHVSNKEILKESGNKMDIYTQNKERAEIS